MHNGEASKNHAKLHILYMKMITLHMSVGLANSSNEIQEVLPASIILEYMTKRSHQLCSSAAKVQLCMQAHQPLSVTDLGCSGQPKPWLQCTVQTSAQLAGRRGEQIAPPRPVGSQLPQ
jgi:hypothetical protein